MKSHQCYYREDPLVVGDGPKKSPNRVFSGCMTAGLLTSGEMSPSLTKDRAISVLPGVGVRWPAPSPFPPRGRAASSRVHLPSSPMPAPGACGSVTGLWEGCALSGHSAGFPFAHRLSEDSGCDRDRRRPGRGVILRREMADSVPEGLNSGLSLPRSTLARMPVPSGPYPGLIAERPAWMFVLALCPFGPRGVSGGIGVTQYRATVTAPLSDGLAWLVQR